MLIACNLTMNPPLVDCAEVTLPMDKTNLYRLYRSKVYRLCLRYSVGNHAWSEDRTHDVFIKLFEKYEALSPSTDVGGWIYRVTVNTCLSRLRREGSVWHRAREAFSLRTPPPRTVPADEQVANKQDIEYLFTSLAQMQANERVVFIMRYIDDWDQVDICRELGLSKGYVSKLLQRAREKLEAFHDVQ